jgi:hypothetical protein
MPKRNVMNVMTLGQCKACEYCRKIIWREQLRFRGIVFNWDEVKYCDIHCQYEGRLEGIKILTQKKKAMRC